MKCDCHIHMVLDGVQWRSAIGRHADGVDLDFVRRALTRYRELGYGYLRDGGDRWGVGKAARDMAEEFGIRYRTPLAPLCKAGHYGAFIGEKYEDLGDFARRVREHRQQGADFIKIMISGLMDFDRFGVLSEEPLPGAEIRELIHIAHEEGFSVMVHANGARAMEAAAEAGVDSIEHGAYADEESLAAMAEHGVVWVPTVSTIGNLLGKCRFDQQAVAAILDSALENLGRFAAMGGRIAVGSDAGAWAVEHGCETEEKWLLRVCDREALEDGNRRIREKF